MRVSPANPKLEFIPIINDRRIVLPETGRQALAQLTTRGHAFCLNMQGTHEILLEHPRFVTIRKCSADPGLRSTVGV